MQLPPGFSGAEKHDLDFSGADAKRRLVLFMSTSVSAAGHHGVLC